jgi:Protein of unknown function (DUF732)
MTSVTTHLRLTSPTLRQPWAARQLVMWVNAIGVATAIVRPLVIALGIIAAAAMWPAPARADGVGDAVTTTLNTVGIGNNGPVSTTIAGIGQSICPMLVQPGAKLASIMTELSGHNGLAPDIAGFVATMAIQTQCPGVMTSIANGNMPFGLQLPGVPGVNPAPAMPFGLPGVNPAPAMPFALPGVNPAPTNPFQVPGL